jgi:hypothetical protein
LGLAVAGAFLFTLFARPGVTPQGLKQSQLGISLGEVQRVFGREPNH